jgi:hypothetical protein
MIVVYDKFTTADCRIRPDYDQIRTKLRPDYNQITTKFDRKFDIYEDQRS